MPPRQFGVTVTVMATNLQSKAKHASEQLDAHVRDIVNWHFNPETGCEYWLNWAKTAGFDPRKEVHGFADLKKFGHFEDEWLRGGPVRRWLTRGLAGEPMYVFETGGGTPASHIPRLAHRAANGVDKVFAHAPPDMCI